MMGTPEHLTTEISQRGFSHMPAIDVWQGYTFPDGRFLDFEVVEPRKVGEVRVYESSDAVIPSIWIRLQTESGDEAGLVTVDNARRLGEQLIALADGHYQS